MRSLLKEDLKRMGCRRLLKQLWCFKNKAMVIELFRAKSNEWKKTLRREPNQCTINMLKRVYGFPRGGEGLTSRTDRFIEDKFSSPMNSKDRFKSLSARM